MKFGKTIVEIIKNINKNYNEDPYQKESKQW
jgi:hypothetical protein